MRNFYNKYSFLILSVLSVLGCNNKLSTYAFESTIEYESYKKLDCKIVECQQMNITFANNPFDLGKSYNVIVQIGEYLIYDGVYFNRSFQNVYVPVKYLNRTNECSICIYRPNSKKGYFFTAKEPFYIDKSHDKINIVIANTNEYSERIIFFSTK